MYDAVLDHTQLTYEIFIGDIDEKKSSLQNFINRFVDSRGQCDPETVLKYAMQDKVSDVGPCLTKEEYPYLADEFLNECLDLIYKLDARNLQKLFKDSGKVGECFHDYAMTELKVRDQKLKKI